jgi:hypothetical protein
MGTSIKRISMLSEEECKKVKDVIFELKEFWVKRYEVAPFYTLGAASYLDSGNNKESYLYRAEHYNHFLKKDLSWLYKKLVEVLEKNLNGSVRYLIKAGLPGFHIYEPCRLFEHPVASIHCDLQYKKLDWKKEETDFDLPISYTMAVKLPKLGGGLNVWDIEYGEIEGKGPIYLKELLQTREKTYIPYAIGEIVLHSGHKLHQAAPGESLKEGDDRITLQGHALFSQGSWQLYW